MTNPDNYEKDRMDPVQPIPPLRNVPFVRDLINSAVLVS